MVVNGMWPGKDCRLNCDEYCLYTPKLNVLRKSHRWPTMVQLPGQEMQHEISY